MKTGWKSSFIKGERGCDIIMASRPALVSLRLFDSAALRRYTWLAAQSIPMHLGLAIADMPKK